MTLQAALDHLELAQIVRRVEASSAADLGTAYRFKHTLT